MRAAGWLGAGDPKPKPVCAPTARVLPAWAASGAGKLQTLSLPERVLCGFFDAVFDAELVPDNMYAGGPVLADCAGWLPSAASGFAILPLQCWQCFALYARGDLPWLCVGNCS